MTKDIERLKYSMPFLPCSLLSRSALRPTRVLEPHGSVFRTEVLPTVEDDCGQGPDEQTGHCKVSRTRWDASEGAKEAG